MSRKQLELNPRKSLFYQVVALILRGIATVFSRPTVHGEANIPATGPVLIAPTHRSNVDFACTNSDQCLPIDVSGRDVLTYRQR